MTQTVLITGASGFIGRHVARHFAADGWLVTGVGHGSWTREEWEGWGLSRWQSGNISVDLMRAVAGATNVIVHCAGSGSVGYSFGNPLEDFQRNVDTTVQALE